MQSFPAFKRWTSDPKFIESGVSSLTTVDRLVRLLGWFGIALGALELAAPRQLGEVLGVTGRAPRGVIRLFGARELGSGVATLSVDKKFGLYSRVAGDMIDIAALLAALAPPNPNRKAAKLAMLGVLGITALDVYAAQAINIQRLDLIRRGRRSFSL